MKTFACICALVLSLPFAARATDYHVGPGQPLSEPGDVPWESLGPGDTVFIHHRATPYAAKWVICRQGTAEAPITVRGVPSESGELPIITGEGATTRSTLNYWNRQRGLIKIGGASVPADAMPQHIVIENLDLRSARPPYSYTSPSGAAESYVNNAAAVYVEKVRFLTVRGCRLTDSGNGLFVSWDSQDVLIEACEIAGNGNVGSIYEHNAYTEALRITYQFNHFGPLREGCGGNNLKDRSAGLVVRYNWIEGGNRQLDLVDAEDSSALVNDPSYRSTFVYGNVLVEHEGSDNRQIVHYGGDSGTTSDYRKGTLYFHHNTIVSTRTGRNTLLRLSTDDESCDARNNIVYTTSAGSNLELISSAGTLHLRGNWLRAGWVVSFDSGHTGSVIDEGGNVAGTDPGFVSFATQDYALAASSACRDAGVALAAAVLPDHAPVVEYRQHLGSAARATADGAPDIGAFEYFVGNNMPLRNGSLRGRVPVGGTMITGMVITGTVPRPVLVRAIGPTLADFDVVDPLPAARLTVYAGSGPFASSGDWGAQPDADEIETAGNRLYAFALARDSRDAAVLLTLDPGSYTFHATGDTGGAGACLVELYDAGDDSDISSGLGNLSSRGALGPDASVMIAGFVVGGEGPKRLLIRAVGPALAGFGVDDALADPVLRVFEGSAPVATNDDWESAGNAAAVFSAAASVYAFALPAGSRDAALLLDLPPGIYTAQATSADGSAGEVLVEVYAVE